MTTNPTTSQSQQKPPSLAVALVLALAVAVALVLALAVAFLAVIPEGNLLLPSSFYLSFSQKTPPHHTPGRT